MSRTRDLLARLREGAAGLALIEFAMVLPFMLLLYLGGYAVADAIACNRKVTITTRAAADLVSQYAIVSAGQVDDVLNAANQIMAPYPAANGLVRVSQLAVDGSGNTTVSWSRAINGSPRAVGSSFTPTAGVAVPNSTLIYAEVAYAYRPAVTFGVFGPVTLSQSIYMVPRVSSTVSCPTC